jgi:carboxymethylenebutenolidase
VRATSETGFYEALPCEGAGPGVLLLHATWGLTDCMRSMCDDLASQGFAVVAPDMFEGATARTLEESVALRARRGSEDRWRVIAKGIDRLQRRAGSSRLGVVGFSMGGHWGLWLAQQPMLPVTATVAFYAVRGGDYRASRSSFQLHLASYDEYVGQSGVAKLRRKLEAAGRPVEFHIYEGTAHWFCEPDHPATFDAAAARLAWKRTITFLHSTLG